MEESSIPWIMLGATIAAALAAIWTGWTAMANWFTAKATRESMTASVLIDCLNAYTNVMRQRAVAIESKSEQQCKDFFRELFDLHWTEFQLWRQSMIPNHVMKAWLSVRRRNYDEKKGRIQITTDTDKIVIVTYKQVWDELNRDQYFEEDDPFVTFMNKIHSQKIKDMKKLREEFKDKEDG